MWENVAQENYLSFFFYSDFLGGIFLNSGILSKKDFVIVGVCPSGILSWWDFVLVGFCLSGILS